MNNFKLLQDLLFWQIYHRKITPWKAMCNFFGEKRKERRYVLFVIEQWDSLDLIYRTSMSTLLYYGINFVKCITIFVNSFKDTSPGFGKIISTA